jgi:hypothetical protein
LKTKPRSYSARVPPWSSGDVEGFAAVAFPIVRRVFAGLIANDLVSVQPMSLPSGLIFFLDFTFSPNLGASGTIAGRTGNSADKSIYGTDQVGSQITGGVDLVGTLQQDLSGPRTATARGYAYASPVSSAEVTASSLTITQFSLTGATDANKKDIAYDPDLLAVSSSAATGWVVKVVVADSDLTQLDVENLAAVTASIDSLNDVVGGATLNTGNTAQIRRLSQNSAANTLLYFRSSVDLSSIVSDVGSANNLDLEFPITDNFTESDTLGAIKGTTTWGLEGSSDIPEIDIKVDSIAVTAQTKKLKAKWTPELGQDLNAYHNLDAEVELTSILSEQIALEIDREILADLVNGATAATRYWSRAPGLFVDSSGAEIGASAAPDFTGTVSEWYETLVETINDVSAQIHRKTLRGGANFVVCGPEVANILEFTAGFRASVTHDDEKGSIGALKTLAH